MTDQMSMGFDVLKLNVNNLDGYEKHVRRMSRDGLRVPFRTKSVIQNPALWFSPDGHVEVMPWRQDRLAKAKSLAKRKDAVLAIALWVQIGDQLNWRDSDNKPKDHPVNLTNFAENIKIWAKNEFGEDNIVSIELHLDESSPHFHILATPINDGKLNAQHWVKGIGSLQKMRASAHSFISKNVINLAAPKRGTGGEEHDPTKGTGQRNSPIQPQKTSLWGKLGIKTDDDLIEENTSLRNENENLKIDLRKEQNKTRNNEKLELSRKEQEYLIKNNEELSKKVKDSAVKITELSKEIQGKATELDGVYKVIQEMQEIDPIIYNSALNSAINKENERVSKAKIKANLSRHCDEIVVGLLHNEIDLGTAAQRLRVGGAELLATVIEMYGNEELVQKAASLAQNQPQSDLGVHRQGKTSPATETAPNRVKTDYGTENTPLN